MMVACEYIQTYGAISFVLKMVGLSKSSYYYVPRMGKRGRQASTHTMLISGVPVTNENVVDAIRWLLSQEFVDYGYVKVTKWLLRLGVIINKKKVFRLMRAEKLLLAKPTRNRSGKTWVKDLLPDTKRPFDYLEFDIKFIQIDGTGRKAMLLTVIDVMSRFNMGQLLQYSVKKEDVKMLFEDIFRSFPFPEQITVRSDNGSQFEAGLVREYFFAMGVTQEFTKPATPEQNAHIESYHSILQRAVCDRMTFNSLENAQEKLDSFRDFYNFERLHSGVNYGTPAEMLRDLHIHVEFPNKGTFTVPKFFCT